MAITMIPEAGPVNNDSLSGDIFDQQNTPETERQSLDQRSYTVDCTQSSMGWSHVTKRLPRDFSAIDC